MNTGSICPLLSTEVRHPDVVGKAGEISDKHKERWPEGALAEMHSDFFWGVVAFAGVAAFAGGCEVVPGSFSSTRLGNNVVKGEVVMCAAVLTSVPVPLEEVLPRHNDAPIRDINVSVKPDNDGHGIMVADSPETLFRGFGQHFGFVHVN